MASTPPCNDEITLLHLSLSRRSLRRGGGILGRDSLKLQQQQYSDVGQGLSYTEDKVTEGFPLLQQRISNPRVHSVANRSVFVERYGDTLGLFLYSIVQLAGFLWETLKERWYTNIFLVCVPLALVSGTAGWSDKLVFISSLVGMIPLAGLLSDVTEVFASRYNPVIGALLNSSFGNGIELIIAVIAVKEGKTSFVQWQMLGSILSNLLFVLGVSLMCSGFTHSVEFHRHTVQVYGSLLMLSVGLLIVPTAFSLLHVQSFDIDLLSHVVAIIMLLCYVSYMLFQLYTHRHLFDTNHTPEEEEGLPVIVCVILLLSITGLITWMSHFLVNSADETASQLDISYLFISLVLVPLVGNVVELSAAIVLARKRKLDLVIGIAIGSSIQVCLLMILLLVIISWIIHGSSSKSLLTLSFHPFSAVMLVSSVLVSNKLIQDGTGSWLSGALLTAMYIAIACAYFLLPGGSSDQV